MTDRELQKLGRRELLQLLLDQAKETDRLSKLLRETEEQLGQLEEGYERLRERLDQKDAQIHELQDTLQAEREKRETDLSEVGSIAEAALRLNGVFDAAQQAADQYLQSVKDFYAIPEGVGARLKQQTPPAPEYPPDPTEWDFTDGGDYMSEPLRSRTLPQEPDQEPAPPRERRSARRESSSQDGLPFRIRKRKGNGKTTLFFGWQHD